MKTAQFAHVMSDQNVLSSLNPCTYYTELGWNYGTRQPRTMNGLPKRQHLVTGQTHTWLAFLARAGATITKGSHRTTKKTASRCQQEVRCHAYSCVRPLAERSASTFSRRPVMVPRTGPALVSPKALRAMRNWLYNLSKKYHYYRKEKVYFSSLKYWKSETFTPHAPFGANQPLN